MKIVAVETFPVRVARDLAGATGTAGSPNELKGQGDYRWSKDYPALYSIHVETALIRVRLEDGTYGWGEAQAPLAPEVACTIADRLLAPVLIGAELEPTPAGIASIWERMYSTMRVRGQTGGFMLDAMSGVDLALWDLAGKLAGLPVAAMLNPAGSARSVPSYLSGVSGASIEEKVAYASRYHDMGFRACKLYYESDWDALLEQVDALSPNFQVAVDALWHLDPDRAAEQAGRLDQRQALWLECPLMPEDAAGHAALARSIETPLAIGESYRTCHELAPYFASRAMGYVQPDLGRSGITESIRIAERARGLGMKVVPHVSIAFGPQIAAAIHLAAALRNCPMCEYNPRVVEVADRFLTVPISMEGPCYLVPTEPGLGIDLDLQALGLT